jgi:hypothetical protein
MRQLIARHCPKAGLLRHGRPPVVGVVILGTGQAGFEGYAVRGKMIRTGKELMN